MKYHSTLSTIVISISIALLFFIVSVFILASLNMTSPTLMLTNKIFEKWESVDSDISISFSSIERNLRDRVFINGIDIKYKGEEFLYFDTLELKRGLFSMIAYILSGNGVLDIEATGGRITVDPILSNETASSPKSNGDIKSLIYEELSIILPEELNNWGVNIDINDVDVGIKDISLDDISLELFFDHGLEGSYCNISLPRFSYAFGNIGASVDNVDISLNIEQGLRLIVDAEALCLDNESISVSASGFELKTAMDSLDSFVLADLPVSARLHNASASVGNVSISSKDIVASILNRGIYLDLLDSRTNISGYALGLDKISLRTLDLNVFDLSLIGLSAGSSDGRLVDIKSISSSISLRDKVASLSIPNIALPVLSTLTSGIIKDGKISGVKGNLDFGTSISFNLAGNVGISSSNELIDDSSFDFAFDMKLVDSPEYSARINNLTIPAIVNDLSLFLIGKGSEISIGLEYMDALTFKADFSDYLELSMLSDGLYVDSILPIVQKYAPSFESYISADTKLDMDVKAKLSFAGDAKYRMVGDINGSVKLNNISFTDYAFSIGADLKSRLEEDEFIFDKLLISTDWLNILYSGKIDFNSELPEGRFSILNSEFEDLFILNMKVSDTKKYTFSAETPLFENLYLAGDVDFATESVISSAATLNLFNRINPFNLRVELDNKRLMMDNSNIDIDVSWDDILDMSIIFKRLPLSPVSDTTNLYALDLEFDLQFDFARQAFSLSIPSFAIKNPRVHGNRSLLSFKASGNNDGVNVDNIIVSFADYNDLVGSAIINLKDFGFALSLKDVSGEQYRVSGIKQDSGYFGILRGENMNMARFGLEGIVGDLNLTGRAERISDFAFSGRFEAHSADITKSDSNISADLFINNELLSLSNFVYANDSLTIKIPSLTLDSSDGALVLEKSEAYKILAHDDRDYVISAGLSMSAQIAPADSLLSSIATLIKTRASGARLGFTLEYLQLDDLLYVDSKSFEATINQEGIALSGSLLSGDFNFSDKSFDIYIDLDPITKLGITGSLGEFEKNFQIKVDSLESCIANLALNSPIVGFRQPTTFYGNLNVQMSESGINAYGNLSCDYGEMFVWWLPEQTLILHNASFVVWDNDINLIRSNVSVVDNNTYSRIPVEMNVGVYFDEGFGFEGWDLDVYIDDPHTIRFRLPMVGSNMDLIGRANGHYRIDFINGVVQNSGELNVDDLVLSMGLRELPEWWNPTMKTTSNFDILLRDNAQIVYPLGPNPILKANVADNTRINFSLDSAGSLSLLGDIALRSGEIYYFQKYFYITEGSVAFRSGSDGIDPIVNLRARLRDFDANGESVDIYLVLREATLSNLSPTFESSPNKDINEIMSILGQAILPSTAYGDTSLTTVVSMATASFDILSRVGVIGSVDNGLASTIKNSLKIDIFSLHTNILSNLVADTVSLAATSSGFSSYSPMARYLDGTSLYMGKYLSPDLYLQAMVHLSANRNLDDNRFSFIADDLNMDMEISLEWSNPLCSVTFFSQPVTLTPYAIMDNFGFTLSKRIVF